MNFLAIIVQTPKELAQLKEAHLKRIERIVCSGGGAKGVVYAGAYQALYNSGVFKTVKVLSGSSAGAIASTLLALGIEPQTFRALLLHTNLKKLMGDGVGLAQVDTSAGRSVLTKDGKPLEAFIRTHIISTVKTNLQYITEENKESERFKSLLLKLEQESPIITFADLALLNELAPEHFKQLIITAVEFPSGKPCIFNSSLTPDVEIALACRASASIPIILAPVAISINGVMQQFVDGGLYNNVPTEYFDHNLDGSFSNTKPEQTLVLAFGEGVNNKNNHVFQALYGPRWDEIMDDKSLRPILYKPGAIEQFSRNTLVHALGGINAPYKNTEQKEAGFQKLRSEYALRTVELRVGEIKTTSFDQAIKVARIMDALGYLDTINYIINHDLYDSHVFSDDHFHHDLFVLFKAIYSATLMGAGKDIKNDKLIMTLATLEADLKNNGLSQEQIAQHAVHFIKDNVEHNLSSSQAFALSRAVEYHNNYLNDEQLFKEVYEEGFKRSTRFFTQSKATGSTIHRTHALHEVLEKKDMFDLYFNQPAGYAKTRMNKVLASLADIFAKHPNQQGIEVYQSSLDSFRLNLAAFDTPFATQPERQIYQYGTKLLTHLNELVGEHPELMKPEKLVDLTAMLECATKTLEHIEDEEETRKHVAQLTRHAQRIAGIDYSSWTIIAQDLLNFSCTVLIFIGLLAAIPTGGTSLLLSAIGAVGLGVSTYAASDDFSVLNPGKKLRKDITHFKAAVALLTEENNKNEPDPDESFSL